MHERAHGVSVAAIDRVLAAGFRGLRFPPAIEARFEQDTGWARCRFLITCGIPTLILFDLFLLRDYALIRDVFSEAALIRLGFITPLGLVMFAVLWRNPPAWLREGMEAGITVIVVAIAVYLYLKSRSPLAAHAHYSLLLIIVFSNIIQHVRFWYACISSVISVALCAVCIPHIEGLPLAAASGAVLTLATTAVLTLITNYTLEYEQRRSYLRHLREELRSSALMDANRELNAISNIDPLTGLANRRQLDQFLDTLWPQQRASGQPVGVLMLDIDHFKHFNDRYGHQQGDRCLKVVGESVSEQLRAEDLVARVGGEELLVVLPGADLAEAVRIAERIRAALLRRAIQHAASPEGVVTVSIGAAAAAPSDGVTQHDLIAAADEALYAAKAHGRNRVWPAGAAAGEIAPSIAPDHNPAGRTFEPRTLDAA
jgi:diguanylate cyclase (GGDEF)-like protein